MAKNEFTKKKELTNQINKQMKKIFLKQYNALFDYPIVKEPKVNDYREELRPGVYAIHRKDFEEDLEGHNKWLSSKIEIVGEHSFEDNQVVVGGVDFVVSDGYDPIGSGYPPKCKYCGLSRNLCQCVVAIPINILNRV